MTEDEHSAALKLLEVTVPPRSCLLHAAADLTQSLMLQCMGTRAKQTHLRHAPCWVGFGCSWSQPALTGASRPQILCLVSQHTREAAQERDACAVLLAKLEADVENGLLAGACLDALLALLAGSPGNGQAFLRQQGLVKVCFKWHMPPPCERAAALLCCIAELPIRDVICRRKCCRESIYTLGVLLCFAYACIICGATLGSSMYSCGMAIECVTRVANHHTSQPLWLHN